MKNLGLALGMNASFSMASGIALVLFNRPLAELFGSHLTVPFWSMGIGLMLFALAVLYVRSNQSGNLINVLIIILLDLGWVAASAAVIYFQLFNLSPTGYFIIAAVAVIVLGFALHQSYALMYADAMTEAPLRKQFRFTKIVNGSRQKVWEVISDLAGYYKIAPNIDEVNILSGEGEGMVRSCRSGEDSWTETCTIWDPENKYSFVVDTSPADYPYPFQFLQGTWGVNTLSNGKTEIIMTFDFEYERKAQLLLIHPVLERRFKKIGRKLLANWKEKIENRDG